MKEGMLLEISDKKKLVSEEMEYKANRLQELLQEFITESLRESSKELIQGMRETLVKELDYQFRLQEEREEEREKARTEKEDLHFKRLDENIRSVMEKNQKRKRGGGK